MKRNRFIIILIAVSLVISCGKKEKVNKTEEIKSEQNVVAVEQKEENNQIIITAPVVKNENETVQSLFESLEKSREPSDNSKLFTIDWNQITYILDVPLGKVEIETGISINPAYKLKDSPIKETRKMMGEEYSWYYENGKRIKHYMFAKQRGFYFWYFYDEYGRILYQIYSGDEEGTFYPDLESSYKYRYDDRTNELIMSEICGAKVMREFVESRNGNELILKQYDCSSVLDENNQNEYRNIIKVILDEKNNIIEIDYEGADYSSSIKKEYKYDETDLIEEYTYKKVKGKEDYILTMKNTVSEDKTGVDIFYYYDYEGQLDNRTIKNRITKVDSHGNAIEVASEEEGKETRYSEFEYVYAE